MRVRALFSLLLALLVSAFLVAPALAKRTDNGEGLLGETNDKIVTSLSLGVLVFFVMVVWVGSAIQTRLDERKKDKEETSG